jgi:hypothetical protein
MRNAFAIFVLSLSAFAQQAPAQDAPSSSAAPAQSAAAPKPVISANARLAAAKTVYLRQIESHNDIPFNVISNGFDGWAKYVVVPSPEKADLIVEVSATEREDSSFAVSSSTSTGSINGKEDQSTKTTKTFTTNNVRMVVLDAHTKTPLWAGNEQPRSAARKNKTEDNLVEAAQKLFQHFHDRVEPPLQ